jgi:molybdate transport system substrate-binding protein
MIRWRNLFLTLLALIAGCSKPAVKIFAAASTQKVVNEIAGEYQAKTGTTVECEFAASSTLARQIEHGAPADLFLSADEEWADYLEKKGLVEQRRPLLENRLVVVEPAGQKHPVKELADLTRDEFKRIAIAGELVPAGRYARHALQQVGILDRISKRLLEGKDVTAVYLYVERGEADAGLVYATDAAGSERVRVAYEVPESLSGTIRYPLVVVRRDRTNAEAAKFADFLAGEAADAIFRKAGFGLAR